MPGPHPFVAAVLVSRGDRTCASDRTLRYDWTDVVEHADRTAAEILEAYTARTALTLPGG
jgi:hypothetical protein